MRFRLCLTIWCAAIVCPSLPVCGWQSSIPSPTPPTSLKTPVPSGELPPGAVPYGVPNSLPPQETQPSPLNQGASLGGAPGLGTDPFQAGDQLPEGSGAVPSLLGTANALDRYYGGTPVRFIAFDEIDDARRQSIAEDVAVLQQLLAKMLPRPNPTALGVNVYSHGEPNAWYVEDRGLILFYAIDRPVAPGEQAEKKPEVETVPDNAWEKARRELLQEQQRYNSGAYPQPTGGGLTAGGIPGGGLTGGGYAGQILGTTGYRGLIGGGPPAYDPQFAEQLDGVVSEALSYIGNFRALAPDDSVTVFVRGPSADPVAGEVSVYAWRVNLADVSKDQPLLSTAITRRQFSESHAGRSVLPAGSWSR